MEKVHLHILPVYINEVLSEIKNHKIIILNKENIGIKDKDRFIEFKLDNNISVSDINKVVKNIDKECLDISKWIIKKYSHLEILKEEYRRRHINIPDKYELEKRLIGVTYSSVFFLWQSIRIKEIYIKKIMENYKIVSFTNFTYIDSNIKFPIEDLDYHGKYSFSAIWQGYIFSDLIKYYNPQAKGKDL